MQKPDPKTPIQAPGYKKDFGQREESQTMSVEVQSQVSHGSLGKGGQSEACIFVRVGVAPKPDAIQNHHNLVENSARLTLDQARTLAEWLQSEITEAETDMERWKNIDQKDSSGLS